MLTLSDVSYQIRRRYKPTWEGKFCGIGPISPTLVSFRGNETCQPSARTLPVIRRWLHYTIRLWFDCSSTALRPFDGLVTSRLLQK